MGYTVIICTDIPGSSGAEEYMERQRRKSEMERRRQKRRDAVKQRVLGAALLAVSILSAVLLDGDATAAVFMMPLGLYLLSGRNSHRERFLPGNEREENKK